MVGRVLMVAFHFPPMRGSSGIQRSLAFVRHLPHYGWQPAVLSAHPRAYAERGDELAVPPGVTVARPFALDTTRHLSWRGRYTRLLALPDPWVSWLLGALPAGLRLIRRLRPAVIWSTYPIATAHLIALLLHRWTGLPWVADMRDPMVDDVVPADPLKRRVYSWLERQIVRHASVMVFTAPGTLRLYAQRYPGLAPERMQLIENGYDEDDFRAAAQQPPPARRPGALQLLHSGAVYPAERDPIPLFDALAALKRRGAISAASVSVVLRASGHDDYLRPLLRERGIDDLVTLAPYLPYHAALAEMVASDGLLLLQAANCNDQLPAKLYECLRAGRPLLALTDPAGDTAAALRHAGIASIAPLDSQTAIAQALSVFLDQLARGQAALPAAGAAAACSRRARSAQLAGLLDRLTRSAGQQSAPPPWRVS
jgi:glycosyltransferase involved in cell wall biosynthesis